MPGPTTSIEIPSRLAARPRDARGYPIPATVLIGQDGKPDFRVTDLQRWLRAVRLKHCALCDQPLGRHLAFVGGPLSHESRYFTDLPMHRACAEYALSVCPYLAAPTAFKYASKLPQHEGFETRMEAAVSPERPAIFFLGISRGYQVVKSEEGLFVRASPWTEVQWWRHGVRVSDPATGPASVKSPSMSEHRGA